MDVSYIIATHNAAAQIRATIEQFKVLRQNQYEVIVSDNHSQDATVAMARTAGAKVVTQSADVITGLTDCYNTGAGLATGEILWLLPAAWLLVDPEGFVDEVIHYFIQNPETIAIIPRLRSDKTTTTLLDSLQWWWRNVATLLQSRLLKSGTTQAGCIIVRRSAFEKIKGFNPHSVGDQVYNLTHQLAQLGEVRMFWHRTVLVNFN